MTKALAQTVWDHYVSGLLNNLIAYYSEGRLSRGDAYSVLADSPVLAEDFENMADDVDREKEES